jgi:hypothetical protein
MADKESEIKLIAYSLWELEGCPNGKDCEHWYRAEAIWEEKNKAKYNSKNAKVKGSQISKTTSKVKATKKKP